LSTVIATLPLQTVPILPRNDFHEISRAERPKGQVDTFELPDWVNNPKYKQAFKLSAPSYNTHPTQGHWEIEFSQPYRSAEVFIRCPQSWEQFEEECRIIAVEQALDRCLL
jgi:hypothetical protein